MPADLLALFSQDEFACLDFDDAALLDKVQRQNVVASMDQLLGYLLRAIGYQNIVRPKDVAFRRDLWAWGYSRLTKDTPDKAHLDIILDTAAGYIENSYPSACHESRMCTGTTTAAAILADDLVEKPDGLEQLYRFSQRYLRGLSQPEGLCAALADGIDDCDKFYGSKNPRGGSFVVMGWLAGLDAFCEEERYAQELPGQFVGNCSRDRRTEWSVEKMPYYLRNLAGLSNCYIPPIFKPSHEVEVPLENWISAIPDIQQFILLVNDLLSFPKEVVALENFNYLSLITRARRQVGRTSLFNSKDGLWTIRDTLHEAFDQLLSCTAALDKLFINFAESLSEFEAAQSQAEMNGLTKGKDRTSKMDREKLENARLAAKYWSEYRQGFIAFHVNLPRYRLSSLRATLGATTDTREIAVGVAAIAA
ncbi:hypothetical protein MMC22_003633 [Lobaria immixta]|nr:hypothetical protein [Lobaria immixta]